MLYVTYSRSRKHKTLTWNCTLQVVESLSPGAKSHTVSRCLKRDPSVHTACCKRGERREKEDIPHLWPTLKYQETKTKPRLKFLFTHTNFAIGDKSEVRGVALYERREAYFQLGLKITRMPFDEAGLPAPGHKVLVLVHVGDHIVQLLRRIPENTHGSSRGAGGVESS